jgi:hypothetical protein
MKTVLSMTPKLGLFFAVVFLAFQITPAVAADSGSGTFALTKSKKPFSVAFKDVYAFRADDERLGPVTVVIFSDSALDKKGITAALRKERSWGAVRGSAYLAKMAHAKLVVREDGNIRSFYLYSQGSNIDMDGGKSAVKINTAKRVEGSYSYDDSMFGEQYKLDLRFATDLADLGAGSPVKH